MKEWKRAFQANGARKEAGIAVLTSDKIDFIAKLIRQDKEGHSHQSKGKPAKRELHLRTPPQQTQVTQLH